jgi:hypothetical protein
MRRGNRFPCKAGLLLFFQSSGRVLLQSGGFEGATSSDRLLDLECGDVLALAPFQVSLPPAPLRVSLPPCSRRVSLPLPPLSA